jgi:hypothetical protein
VRLDRQLPAARLWGRAWQKLATVVCKLIQTNGAALFALYFLGVTLNSGCCFALETTQSYVEGFVLFNFDGWHPELPSFITGVNDSCKNCT